MTIELLRAPLSYKMQGGKLTEQEKNAMPIIKTFECCNFKVQLTMTYDPQSYELFIIELEHLYDATKKFQLEMTVGYVQNHPLLKFLKLPAIVYLQMEESMNTLRIMESGEIKFDMQIVRDKIQVSIFVPRKCVDAHDYVSKQDQLCQKIAEMAELKSKNAELDVEIFKAMVHYNQSKIGLANARASLKKAQIQNERFSNFVHFSELTRRQLTSALKKSYPSLSGSGL